MEKKILVIMFAMLIAAVLLVGAVMVSSGGFARTGGFTKLFDKLVNDDDTTYDQVLELPDSWDEEDVKTVSDTIVDMRYEEDDRGYLTTLWFVYKGDKWNDPERGTLFRVPDSSGDSWMIVRNGLFSVDVWSISNLSAKYDVGDTITIENELVLNNDNYLAFSDEWTLSNE